MNANSVNFHSLKEDAGIEISKVEKTSDRSTLFSYTSKHFGQCNFLMIRCKEEGIAALNFKDEVHIFSKRKLPLFVKLIKESLTYVDIPFPKLERETTTFWVGKALVCVMIKKDDRAYVTEGHMSKLIWNIYLRRIPKVSNFEVFATRKELEALLLEKENLIV